MRSYSEVINDFEKIKNELRDVDTRDKTSGIYLMYIDGISLDYLIPIYVGQSVNLYNRRSSHRGNTKKLYILSKMEYNKQIPLNAGKYLYCKLVSTLKNNNKTLEDIKFKVLEHCEKEKLDEREKYWINFFESSIYGFNQFEEIIQSNKIMSELQYAKETPNYNKIAREGRIALEKFEDKIRNFDESLLKYKYYSANYTLLLGNYNVLHKTLSKMIIDHSLEMNENIEDILKQIGIKLKDTITMFMGTEYLKWGNDLFKEFEIK
ncbi:MAG: hypothetical protein IJK18_02675 [Clostridia bacterium]|nr:hypothetical protein [Clostridia bacterium]